MPPADTAEAESRRTPDGCFRRAKWAAYATDSGYRRGRTIIGTVRSSPPARRVRSAAGNVAMRYPSLKMGVTIQAESHRVELAGFWLHGVRESQSLQGQRSASPLRPLPNFQEIHKVSR